MTDQELGLLEHIKGAMMSGNVSQSIGITFPFLLLVFYKKSKPIKFV